MSRLRFESESVLIYSARFTLRKDLWQDPPFNEILAGFLARFFSSLEIFAGDFLEISSESLRNFCRILVGFLAHFISWDSLSNFFQNPCRILAGFGGFLQDSRLIFISWDSLEDSWRFFATSLEILTGFLQDCLETIGNRADREEKGRRRRRRRRRKREWENRNKTKPDSKYDSLLFRLFCLLC